MNDERILEVLQAIDRKLGVLLEGLVKAEAEVPEHIRRFTMYYHDLVHIKWAYEDVGVPAPDHVLRENERAHDRMRHLIERENYQGGTFERVRAEMEKEEGNQYSHRRRE